MAAACACIFAVGVGVADAACNLIPIVRREFPSTSGRINSPITAPGEQVTLTLTTCDAVTAFDPVAGNNEVLITFVPPGTGVTTDVSITSTVTVEHCLLDGTCLPCTALACNTLRFTMPDTDDDLAPAADGIGLAGPAQIRVTRDGGATQIVLIDDLYQPTAGCDQEPETVFQKFTVLPLPNRVVDLCDPAPGTPCTGSAGRLLVTLDGDGNLLVPLDHTDVLPLGPGAPVAILESGSTSYPAFSGFPDSISDAVASVIGMPQEPEDLLRAFTLDGRPLPPLLVLDDGGGVLGSADAVTSVIRLRRVDAANNPLFDISDRLYTPGPASERKGPVVINPAFEVALGATVPIKGLRSTGRAVAFARDETLASEPNLNGDTDQNDRVVQVIDVASATSTNTQRAVAEVRSGVIGVPEVAVAGTTVAFLESERAQSADVNDDGDELDTVLRVYDSLGNPRTSLALGAAIDADPVLSVDGRSLQISEPLVFSRRRTGRLTAVEERPFEDAIPPYGVFDPKDVVVSHDGANVYVADLDTQSLMVYARDLATGKLRFVDAVGNSRCNAGRDGRQICIADSDCDTTPGAGDGDCMTGAEIFGTPCSVALSPDDKHLYLNTLTNDIVTLMRDAGDGRLRFASHNVDFNGLIRCRTVVSPDGEHIYAAWSGQIHRMDRDPVSGAVTALGLTPSTPPENLTSLVFDAAGTRLYVGSGSSGIHVFDRNPANGDLVEIQTVRDGVGGVDGIGGLVEGIAISPDGRHLYAAGRSDNAIAIFSRDSLTGLLTQVGILRDGIDVDGLLGPTSIVVSPDGRYLFATCGGVLADEDGGALMSFQRDSTTGLLTFLDSELDDTAGVSLLGESGVVASSPDGSSLYIAQGVLDVTATGGLLTMRATSDLQVFDTATGLVRPAATIDAGVVAVGDGGRAAFLRAEGNSGGTDVNLDGDTADEIAYYYNGAAGPATVPQSLGVAADRIAIAGDLVAMTIDELADGARSLSSKDSDTADDVVFWWRPGDPVPVPASRTAGNSAVGPSIGTTSTANGEFIVFLEPETGNGVQDLNEDGDTTDVVLSVIKPVKSFSPALPQVAAVDFMVEGDIVAFRANEAQQGNLNGDGDSSDAVMYAVDLRDPNLRPISTHQAAEVCNLPGCEPFTPYKIRGDTISFLTNEIAQDEDLNGNGVIEDVTVLHVFNVRSRRLQRFELTAAAPLLDPFPKTLFDDSVLYNEAIDVDDLDGDGFTDDIVVLVAGDADEDGTYNDFDTCVEIRNPDQVDGDYDALGDLGCDPDVTPCAATPLVGCKAPTAPGKSSLNIVDDADPDKDRIAWKWGAGDATALEDFGDPVGGAVVYSLCIYDTSMAGQPLMTALMFAGGTCDGKPCWKTAGTGSYKFKDKVGYPNGLQTATLKAGLAGKATVNVKGRGGNLALPPLPLTAPVRVQMIASTAAGQACWDASFETDVQRNEEGQFKARSN